MWKWIVITFGLPGSWKWAMRQLLNGKTITRKQLKYKLDGSGFIVLATPPCKANWCWTLAPVNPSMDFNRIDWKIEKEGDNK